MRLHTLLAILLTALLATSLAGVMAQTRGPAPPPQLDPAAPGGETGPQPSKSVPASKPTETGKKQSEEGPKIVRWVCTDRVCGGCDGQCARHGGHVAVSHRGHCASTQGSRLDQAIRQAFKAHQMGH